MNSSGAIASFAIAAVAISVSMPVAGQGPSVAKPQYEAWKLCVMTKAEWYSKGPDSAEVIARVAVLACKAEKSKFWDKMNAERVEPGVRNRIAEMLEKSMTEDVAVFVMELRARK